MHKPNESQQPTVTNTHPGTVCTKHKTPVKTAQGPDPGGYHQIRVPSVVWACYTLGKSATSTSQQLPAASQGWVATKPPCCMPF